MKCQWRNWFAGKYEVPGKKTVLQTRTVVINYQQREREIFNEVVDMECGSARSHLSGLSRYYLFVYKWFFWGPIRECRDVGTCRLVTANAILFSIFPFKMFSSHAGGTLLLPSRSLGKYLSSWKRYDELFRTGLIFG
jgi:hypothetical protein